MKRVISAMMILLAFGMFSGCKGVQTKGDVIGQPSNAAVAAGQTKNLERLAVKTLQGKGVETEAVETLSEILCTQIGYHQKFDALCPADIVAMLQNSQVSALMGACEDDSCTENLGNLLETPWVVSGSVGKVGEEYVINLTLMSTSGQQAKRRVVHTVGCKDDLVHGIREAADKLMK